jgi:hypothetical protein
LDQRRGIAELERYARHHSQMYVRLAAYQGLGLLSDLSGVEELRKNIRENEKSTYLKNIFDSFP